MLQDRKPQQPDNEPEKDEKTNGEQGDRFESDTQRIVHRHLQNRDDVITDEDIASVRIGMSPENFQTIGEDEPSETVANEENEAEDPENDRVTPWDTVDNDE